MQFYLTKEQETILDIPYFISLQEKENELKELRKKTGKIQKYTAKAYILKEPRIFIIEDGFKIDDGHPKFDRTYTTPVPAKQFAAELIKHTYRAPWSLPEMPA